MALSGEGVRELSPGDTCSARRHFWLSPWRGGGGSGGERCHRHLAGRGQGPTNCTGQPTAKSSLAPSGNSWSGWEILKNVFSLQCLTSEAGTFITESGCSLAEGYNNAWPAGCWRESGSALFSLEADAVGQSEGRPCCKAKGGFESHAGTMGGTWHTLPACFPPLLGRKPGTHFKKCSIIANCGNGAGTEE